MQDVSISPFLNALQAHKAVAVLDISHNLLGTWNFFSNDYFLLKLILLFRNMHMPSLNIYWQYILTILKILFHVVGNETIEKIQQIFNSSNQKYGGLTLDLHCNRFGPTALFQVPVFYFIYMLYSSFRFLFYKTMLTILCFFPDMWMLSYICSFRSAQSIWQSPNRFMQFISLCYIRELQGWVVFYIISYLNLCYCIFLVFILDCSWLKTGFRQVQDIANCDQVEYRYHQTKIVVVKWTVMCFV